MRLSEIVRLFAGLVIIPFALGGAPPFPLYGKTKLCQTWQLAFCAMLPVILAVANFFFSGTEDDAGVHRYHALYSEPRRSKTVAVYFCTSAGSDYRAQPNVLRHSSAQLPFCF